EPRPGAGHDRHPSFQHAHGATILTLPGKCEILPVPEEGGDMGSSLPQHPHRLERLGSWMEDEGLDCTVVFGTDNVNHLCGYWRYFGGPSALVVPRDGERRLAGSATRRRSPAGFRRPTR